MPLMTVEELERDSRISKHTWRVWIKQGMVPAIRLGRLVRVLEADYHKLIRQSRIQAKQDGSPDVL